MKRIRWLWLAVAVMGCAGAAEGADLRLNVDCEFGWQGCYRPLRWMPVDIEIYSAEKTFPAVIQWTGPQDEMTTATLVHECVLAPDTPYRAPLVAKLTYGAPECYLRIDSPTDQRAWQKIYRLWDWDEGKQVMKPVAEGDLLLVVSGRNDFGLRSLEKAAHGGGSGSPDRPQRAGQVYVKDRLPRRLPLDWPAYDALDLLVLYDPDWTALVDGQKAAIRQWVSGGGRLLMILGSHPLPADDPLARMLPLRLGEARRLELPDATVQAWGCSGGAGRTVTCWTMEHARPRGWEFEDAGAGVPLFARGPVGFGRVGVLAFDPAALGGAQGENLVRFWVEHVNPLLGGTLLQPGARDDDERSGYYGYEVDPAAAGTNAVLNFLLDIPEMRPISIVWVALLLLGLAILIGPVDYVILKRRDRLPLTWLTFACYIAGFSVLAYFGVRVLRAGHTQLRAVSVWDGVEGHEHGWSCCWSGIFASDTDNYRLSGLERDQLWSAASPLADRYMVRSRGGGGSRRVTCAQEDGGSLPVYVPVNIWSMQCLMTQRCEPPVPLAAQVTQADGRVTATVENLSDTPIAGGSIRFAGNRHVPFGRIPARGTIRVDAVPSVAPPWRAEPVFQEMYMFLPSRAAEWEFTPEAAYCAGGVAERTRAIEDWLMEGAAVVCVTFDDAPLGFGLEGRSARVFHRRLARLVVFP